MTGVSRRAFIGGGIAAGVALGVGIPFALNAGSTTSTGNPLTSKRPLPRPFTQPLTIPPVLDPTSTSAAGDHYRITQKLAQAAILPDANTEIFGYNGIFPGPTIVSRRGRPTIVEHTNELPVPTVVHLHGGHTTHESDGYPTDYIYPVDMSYLTAHQGMHQGGMGSAPMPAGDTTNGHRTYTYPMDQRAAMLWYHDHRMDFTGPSVWKGLAGFHIVRDDEEEALGVPTGPRELPLMITDRSFDADGSLLYPSIDPSLTNTPGVTGDYVAGVLGDVMLVNGTPWPVTQVDAAAYRLRILNACNARRLDLRLDPQPATLLTQIGTEGGLLAAPITFSHFELAPAQRLDAIIDFSGYVPGTAVTLHNDFGEAGMSSVMRFIVGDVKEAPYTVPRRLSTIERLTADQAVVTRTFNFQQGDVDHRKGWLINGGPFSSGTVAASAQLGSVEVWHLIADFHHPVHLHLSPFQILGRGIGGPGEFDAGWKDTIDLRPAEAATIAVRFEDYVGKFVFHCHNLEHEDMAMMANFTTH